jgi:hypothetical protein
MNGFSLYSLWTKRRSLYSFSRTDFVLSRASYLLVVRSSYRYIITPRTARGLSNSTVRGTKKSQIITLEEQQNNEQNNTSGILHTVDSLGTL